MIESIDPASGERVRLYDSLSESEIEHRLALAWSAFLEHRKSGFASRAAWLLNAAEILEAESEALGRLMAGEMGKPLAQGTAEAEKCAWVCRYYAENGERFLASEEIESDAVHSYVRYDPLGPVLAVMPWNFPLWQVFRFAAPAIMAGNVCLLKHASNVPGCALAIEDVFTRAGLPAGVFQTLLVGTDAVETMLDDDRVRAATLTGSTAAGSAVAGRAGKRIKKTVLELGGSDPFIVMPSADLGEAVRTAVRARTINNGQSCIAAKRFIVHEDVYEEFESRFVEGMRELRTGDPLDPSTEIGPLATASIRDEVHGQVERSVKAGARLLLGGTMPLGAGFYYPPTVLADAPSDAPAYREEIFGPVATLFRVQGADQALTIANDTPFGLGSSVWTMDSEERELFIGGIEAGQVFVNAMVASDPRLPFGGVKESGYGRELGIPGIREFVNVKTISISEPSSAVEGSSRKTAAPE